MKKIFTQIFLMSLMLLSAVTAGAQSFSGGTGTETDPYQISDAADLKQLSRSVAVDMNTYAGSYFVMTGDIDMAGVTDFDPIGNNFSGDLNPFSGTFDGNGHRVFNLNREWEELGFVGLFGVIMNATIKNVVLDTSNIYGDLSVGGIVGVAVMDNTISNCHTTADVTIGVRKFYIAGICGGTLLGGTAGTVIKDCTNSARIIGCVGYSAGILGTNGQNNTQVLRCANFGEISDDQLHVAGIVAHTKNGISIEDCFNTGKISMLALEGADNARGAGILADGYEVPAEECIMITNCYNAGEMNAENEKTHAIYQGDYYSYNNTFLTNCYYSSDLYKGDYDCSEAMSSDMMKTQDFVDKLNAGRTTDACWVIAEGVNQGFPVTINEDGVHTAVCSVAAVGAAFSYAGGVASISGAEAGTALTAADMEGRIVATAAADAAGCAAIDMNVLARGIYVVSAAGKSIKVVR